MVTVAITWSVPGPQPTDDQRQREGDLDLGQDLPLRHPTGSAASMVLRSTDSKPAYAPASIEGIARMTNAMVAPTIRRRVVGHNLTEDHEQEEQDSQGGQARIDPVKAMVNCSPRPVCPI